MTRFLFALAFALGAVAVIWVGVTLPGSSAVALIATLLIGLVYAVGFVELLRFRRATAGLRDNLRSLPTDPTALDAWLNRLPPALRNPVRRRIEGEPAALPGPTLTPYLTGLLVMLGLLGTFIGMLVTLHGAVSALQGGADLQAIRGSLIAPIAGMSLAFGTSIAGVAASAMLGLAAALSRRDRLVASRELDAGVGGELRVFSFKQQRNEAYQALRDQAGAFPAVVEQLQALTGRLDRMGEQLGETLTTNQRRFQDSLGAQYRELADSVGTALKDSLAESTRLAAESTRPVMEAALERLNQQTERTHRHLNELSERQLAAIGERFQATTEQAAESWRAGLAEHQESAARLALSIGETLRTHQDALQRDGETHLSTLNEAFRRTTEQAAEDWRAGLHAQRENGERLTATLDSTLSAHDERLRRHGEDLLEQTRAHHESLLRDSEAHLSALAERFEHTTGQAAQHWQAGLEAQQRAGERLADRVAASLEQHDARFRQNSETLLEQAGAQQQAQRQSHAELIHDIGATLNAHNGQFQSTAETLLAGQRDGLDTLVARIGEQLTALRDQEAQRAGAASERLAALEDTVRRHLTTLGTALEAPMTRLIETASETPRAAAEVIGQLRAEMTRNSERDNELLEERQRLMSELDALLSAQREASSAQRDAIESLIRDSGRVLAEVGQAFAGQVDRQAEKLDAITAEVTGSAHEVASLSDAFATAVQLFSDANDRLVGNLERIETSLAQSSARSDEQLAYYVEQAREVIDLSMASQKEVLDALGALRGQGKA